MKKFLAAVLAMAMALSLVSFASAEETYTIVTNDFMGAGGDTYYAFSASPIGYDLGVPLDEVVMDYITSVLGGVVTEAQYGQTASTPSPMTT